MKKLLIVIIILLIFISIPSFSACAQKKILVIHSYHQGLEWTDEISEGIRSVFSYEGDVKVYYEYLDAKRNYSKEYYNKLINLYREKARLIDFDAIIVSDNAALDFVVQYGGKLYPGTPIVFCGINNFNKKMLNDKDNIYGVVERASHKQTLDLIFKLHPNINKLLIINDRTQTGRSIRQELEKVLSLYKDRVKIEIWDTFTIKELQKKLKKINQDVVLYLLVVNRDKNGRFISYNEGIRKIKTVCQNPIYGAWDFYLGKGIIGGKIINGVEQGREAAKLTKKVIHNQEVSGKKIKKDNVGTTYMFDYQQLKEFDIKEAYLPQESKLINEPTNFLKENYQLLIWGLIILFIVIIILIFRLYFKLKKEEEITELNRRLEKKVEERTKELEKTNQKLKQMIITDELTQLYNRKGILQNFDLELKKAKRYNRDLSIIMIDIDHFKKVNDTHGHQFGDKVLKIVSQTLQKNVRKVDLAGRYGGEEFLIVLPETNLSQGYKVAEKLRTKIKNLEIENLNWQLTISCGVAEFKDNSGEEIIKKADNLLYKAKEQGRDVTIADGIE